MVGGLLILACGEPPPEPEVVAPAPAPAPAPFDHDAWIREALAKAPAGLVAVNPRRDDPSAIAAGEPLYAEACAPCHGLRGDGDGPAAAALPQRPADFTDAARWAATGFGQKLWLVQEGIPGTPHAPSDLTEEQLAEALAYVESAFAAR